MIVNQEVVGAWRHLSSKGSRCYQTVPAIRLGVSDFVGLHDLPGRRNQPELLPKCLRHRVWNGVKALKLVGRNWQEDRPLSGKQGSQILDALRSQQIFHETFGRLSIAGLCG